MIIAIEDIYANLDAWAADLAEARYWARRMKAQRDDLRNESDKLLMDLIDSEKERDALQAKLDREIEHGVDLLSDVERLMNERNAIQEKLEVARGSMVSATMYIDHSDIEVAKKLVIEALTEIGKQRRNERI